jgi:hypothetical protein
MDRERRACVMIAISGRPPGGVPRIAAATGTGPRQNTSVPGSTKATSSGGKVSTTGTMRSVRISGTVGTKTPARAASITIGMIPPGTGVH